MFLRKLQLPMLSLFLFSISCSILFSLPMLFADEASVLIQINTNKVEYHSGDEIKGEIKIINTQSREYRDVDIKVESELIEKKAFRMNLGPNEEFTIEPIVVAAPYLSTSKEKEITVTVNYQDNGKQQVIETKKILILKNENFESLIKIEFVKKSLDATSLKVGVNISLNQQAKEREALTPEQVKKIHLDILMGAESYLVELSPKEITDLFLNGHLQREILVVLKKIDDSIGINTELIYLINDLSYTKSVARVLDIIEEEDNSKVKVELIKKKDEAALQIRGQQEHVVRRIVYVLLALVVLAFFTMSLHMFFKKQKESRLRKFTVQRIKGEQTPQEQGFVEKMKTAFMELEPPKPEQGHDALEQYAAYWIARGKSKQYVKEKLLKAGWLEEVVDIYMEMIS